MLNYSYARRHDELMLRSLSLKIESLTPEFESMNSDNTNLITSTAGVDELSIIQNGRTGREKYRTNRYKHIRKSFQKSVYEVLEATLAKT
jgi:hypothetical protein